MKTVKILLFFLFILCNLNSQAQNNALDFDGSNDYVTVPAKTSYDITTGTIECMAKPSSFGNGITLLGVRGAGGTRYSFHLSPTAIGMWNGSTYLPLNYTFNTGTWYHIAFVCTGPGETKCYINGTLIGAMAYGFSSVTGQPLVIGAVKEGSTPQEYWSGSLDEVRIWNTIRTPEEIVENKDVSLLGTETGLMALFTFNQGTAGGTNTSETILLDKTASSNNGTLFNFTLTGSGSNYVSSPLTTAVTGTLPWTLGGNAGTTSSSSFLGTTDFRRLIFKTNNQERLTILPNGNVGIGTTSPGSAFTVKQQSNGIGIQLQAPDGDYSNNYLKFGTIPDFPFISSMWSNGRLDLSAGTDMFLFGNNIYFKGNAVINRLGDPTSQATSQSSGTMPFESNLWNGTAGVLTYAGIQNVASTTTALAHRLAFKLAATTTDLQNGLEAVSILSSGNVGIGIIDPKVKLVVNGDVKCTKLTVTATPWADFVFNSDYKLASLEQVERYIKDNKHLQDIPSVAEVNQKGIDVGTQQSLLLQKLEEVTLYLIEQSKLIKQQQRDINQLRRQIKVNRK